MVGVGSLLWLDASERRICRPIFTVRVNLSLHRQTGRIELNPPEVGIEIKLEQDMLEPSQQPPKECQTHVEKKAAELESIWDRETVLPVLKEWFHDLPSAADANFSNTLDFANRASSVPQMAFGPILMLRKRRGHSVLMALKQIEESLRQGVKLPRGLREICGEERGDTGGDALPNERKVSLPEETLFPLPANAEQQLILDRLGGHSGVLVQGPPGTGKSHTIVNLVCHLLAQGKRVLVTSQTPRALRVLQDKFPKDILPLVVSVLDEKEDSRRNLERSVHGILHAVDDPTRDPAVLEQRISQATNQRVQLRAELSKLRRLQRELREADTQRYPVPGTSYSGTPQQIATALDRDAIRFAWFDDDVSEIPGMPLSTAHLAELFQLYERLGSQVDELATAELPVIDSLPHPDEFEQKFQQWKAAERETERHAGVLSGAANFATLPSEALVQLQTHCRNWLRTHTEFADRTDWRATALRDLFAGNGSTWWSLVEQTETIINAVRRSVADIDPTIENADSVSTNQLLADAEDLLQHLASGGGFGIWLVRSKVVRRTQYLWSQVRVDGRLCQEKTTLQRLVNHLRCRTLLDRARQEWPAEARFVTGTIHAQLSCLEENWTGLRRLLTLNDLAHEVRECLALHDQQPPPTNSAGAIEGLLRESEAALVMQDEKRTEWLFIKEVDRVETATELTNSHPPVISLRQAALRWECSNYRRAFTDLSSAFQQHLAAQHCCELHARVMAVAPRLATRLRSDTDRQAIANKLVDFDAAWAWRRTAAWLERYDTEHSDNDLRRRLKQTEDDLKVVTAKIVANKAWLKCLSRLSAHPHLQGSMGAWVDAVERIGAGTGIHAESHRRDARKHLADCWDAIPAHVMPLVRVAEQFKFEQPEMFDVVIVDESSQTGPEGLLLSFIGKQLIVVGDDKQISPEEGFVKPDEVRQLIQQHISDIPFSDRLLPGASLFRFSRIRYRSQITLREHFRCMPEIIRFSNDLSYSSTPLIPLRQYPADRLTPLVDRFVTDGYREGTSERVINRPEAAAVAKSVIECLEDSRYRGKSFGVICLQGHAQAQLIEQMILERIGPEPFKDPKIRLLCGDPYSFQGDERDIIFLSMVAAVDGDSRNAALTQKKFLQRFNVAASRARDQMWLFHSIRDGDLHPSCVRRRLVQFMSSNPELQAPTVDLAAIRHEATHTKRERRERGKRGNQPMPFDSWFEVDVFLAMIDRGYRVLPQYRVAEKSIDLVVEDARKRIAIECDGDEWHGPEQYEADEIRQTMLERCGWQFARVRGSIFYANRTRAIEKLIEEITDYGVRPWSPKEGDATYDALDIAEVSGASCLQRLGEQLVDTAEAGLSQVNVVEDDNSTDANENEGDDQDDHTPPGQRSLFQVEDKTNRPESPPDRVVEEPLEIAEQQTNENNGSLIKALAYLAQANRPSTAGQIRWHTMLAVNDWPEIEQVLLQRGFVHKIGTGPRARFQLLDDWLQRLAAESLEVPPVVDEEVEAVSYETWFKIAHWAKENNHLKSWQRSVAYSIGVATRAGAALSQGQILQGKRILHECRQLGFPSS